MRERDDFMKDKMRKYAYPDSRFGEHPRYLDGGDKVLILNRRKGTLHHRATRSCPNQGINDNREKGRSGIVMECLSVRTHS